MFHFGHRFLSTFLLLATAGSSYLLLSSTTLRAQEEVIGITAPDGEEPEVEESVEEMLARLNYEEAAAQIRQDLSKEMQLLKLPLAKRLRITRMAIEAYQMNGNQPLWDVDAYYAVDRELVELLKFNGIPDPLRVDFASEVSAYREDSSPVATDDLRITLRLAEICLLLKEGPHEFDFGWGDEWLLDDFSGEGDTGDQQRRLSYHFANRVADHPDQAMAIAISYIPRNMVYRRLIEELLKISDSDDAPLLFVSKTIKKGDPFFQAQELAIYLQELGHLNEFSLESILSNPSGVYTGALSDAVASFQRSKGLSADGILGPATANRISRGAEIERSQIWLNLHRARYLPNDPGDRYVLVNLPSARAYAFDGTKKSLETSIVFGQDEDGARTPIFRDRLEYMVFRPTGKMRLPSSFASELGEDIADILSNNYRSGANDDDDPARVKFLFPNPYEVFFQSPNDYDVFKEKTNAIIERSVQLKDPEDMAKWVLQDQEGWTGSTVSSAMRSTRTDRWVKLEQPIAVYIVYFTAFPKMDQATGIDFHLDCYSRDSSRLTRALASAQ